jgi:hypothetical protein
MAITLGEKSPDTTDDFLGFALGIHVGGIS